MASSFERVPLRRNLEQHGFTILTSPPQRASLEAIFTATREGFSELLPNAAGIFGCPQTTPNPSLNQKE
jgi:hypothetical protein